MPPPRFRLGGLTVPCMSISRTPIDELKAGEKEVQSFRTRPITPWLGKA